MAPSLRDTYEQYVQGGGVPERFAHEVIPGSGIIATAVSVARGIDFRTQQVPKTNALVWENAQMTASILDGQPQVQ